MWPHAIILGLIGLAVSDPINFDERTNPSLPRNHSAAKPTISLGLPFTPRGLRAVEIRSSFPSTPTTLPFADMVHMWASIIHDSWVFNQVEPFGSGFLLDPYVRGSTTMVEVEPGVRFNWQNLGYGILKSLRVLFEAPNPTPVTIRVPTIAIWKGRPKRRIATVEANILPMLERSPSSSPRTATSRLIYHQPDIGLSNQTFDSLNASWYDIVVNPRRRVLPLKDMVMLHAKLMMDRIWSEDPRRPISEVWTIDDVLTFEQGDISIRVSFLDFDQQGIIMTFGSVERVPRYLLTREVVRSDHISFEALAFHADAQRRRLSSPYLKLEVGLTSELPILHGKRLVTSHGTEGLLNSLMVDGINDDNTTIKRAR